MQPHNASSGRTNDYRNETVIPLQTNLQPFRYRVIRQIIERSLAWLYEMLDVSLNFVILLDLTMTHGILFMKSRAFFENGHHAKCHAYMTMIAICISIPQQPDETFNESRLLL